MTNVNYPHESRRRNSERTKPSWLMIKFYKQIHDSTILSINMPFRAKLPFLSYFSFSLFLSLSFFFSHNHTVLSLTISLHLLPRISNTLRAYSFYRMNLSRCVRESKITPRIVQDFLSFGYSLLFIFASHFFFFLSYFLSFFLVLSLPFSLSVSFSYDIAIVHTAWPLEIVVCVYLTMIYLHVTYTSTSQMVGSPSLAYMILPFAASIQKGGEGVSRV